MPKADGSAVHGRQSHGCCTERSAWLAGWHSPPKCSRTTAFRCTTWSAKSNIATCPLPKLADTSPAKSRNTTVGSPTVPSRPKSSAASTRRSSIFPPVIRQIPLLTRITEVRSTVTEIADYTRHRQTEEVQRKEREAELLAQAEKRRAAQRSRTGFDPTPADFCPRLSDRQIAVLTEHINRIGIFKRDTTEAEIARLLACQLAEPLQTTHNKLLALLLESLSASRLITPKWQRVAGNSGCFTSKLGKPLTAKDLSAAKQMAEIIDRRKERMILDCIEALEAAE